MIKSYSTIITPLLLIPLALSAQTWDGDSGNNWTTDANWVEGSAPVNNGTATVTFDDSTATNFTTVVDTPYNINFLQFEFDSSPTTFNFSGSTLTFSGSNTTIDINTGGDFTQVIDNNIQIDSAELSIIAPNDNGNITVFNGDISGTGGLKKGGNLSMIRLFGNNTFSGGFTTSRGDVGVGSDTAFGTGAVNLNGGGTSLALINLKGSELVLENNINFGTNNTIENIVGAFEFGNFTFNGDVNLTTGNSSNADRGFVALDGITLTFNGSITQDSNGRQHDFKLLASQNNDGNMVVNGDGSYTGQLILGRPGFTAGGIVFINGDHSSSSLTDVLDGATLSGTGTVSQTTLNTGATLNPGDENGNNGQLTIAGDLTVGDSSTVVMDLDASGISDSILLTNAGEISIGASTILSLTSATALSGEYFIFSFSENQSDYGSFATILLNGSAQDWLDSGYTIGYGATGISLTAVPEPGHYALMFGGSMVLLCAWRRRRTSASLEGEKHN